MKAIEKIAKRYNTRASHCFRGVALLNDFIAHVCMPECR